MDIGTGLLFLGVFIFLGMYKLSNAIEDSVRYYIDKTYIDA